MKIFEIYIFIFLLKRLKANIKRKFIISLNTFYYLQRRCRKKNQYTFCENKRKNAPLFMSGKTGFLSIICKWKNQKIIIFRRSELSKSFWNVLEVYVAKKQLFSNLLYKTNSDWDSNTTLYSLILVSLYIQVLINTKTWQNGVFNSFYFQQWHLRTWFFNSLSYLS